MSFFSVPDGSLGLSSDSLSNFSFPGWVAPSCLFFDSLISGGISGDAKLVILPAFPANALPNGEPERGLDPDPKTPNAEGAPLANPDGEALEAELKAELAKDRGAEFGFFVRKGEELELAVPTAKGEPETACPKALALKA